VEHSGRRRCGRSRSLRAAPLGASVRLSPMSVTGAMRTAATPLRAAARILVAPTRQERAQEREDAKPLLSREERAEAGRRHADAHIKQRDARRARSARGSERNR
jgi:hypothetical protein